MIITFGSLFSGMGGFDLGFDRAGMECMWQVEIDKSCQSVLARHWPNVMRYNDVKQCGKDNLAAVDLICGGFPCQDLSVAGKRAGLAGERSGLWYEFHRIIAELKPRWVVIENVPGLLSSNGGRDFAVILRGLVECGYGVSWRILDAQYFGVAQRRRRVFIVASLGDGCAAEVLFEREGGSWNPAPSRETGQGAAAAITGSPYADNGSQESRLIVFDSDRDGQDATIDLSPTLKHGGDEPHHHTAYRKMAVAFGGNNQSGPIDIAAACNAHGGTGRIDFESETFIAHNQRGGYGIGKTVKGEGGGTKPHVAGGFGVRRLTPVECERLQGFPDGWTGGQSDSTRYRQLGNAVCVNVIEWIGKRIKI